MRFGKKEGIILLFIIISLLFIKFIYAGTTAVNECIDLSIDGETYELANSVNATGTCFNVSANNIILDCKGYNLNFSIDNGLFNAINNSNGQDNITIKNCNIYQKNGYGRIIYFIGPSYNNTFIYNNISSYQGTIFHFKNVNYSNISNNILSGSTFINNSGRIIDMFDGYNFNNIIYNNFMHYSNKYGASYAIGLSNSNNNNITNNVINFNTSSTNTQLSLRIIWLSSSNNNLILKNNLTFTNKYQNNGKGIYLSNSDNNNITSNNIKSNKTHLFYPIYIDTGSNLNSINLNRIENSSFDIYVNSYPNEIFNNTMDNILISSMISLKVGNADQLSDIFELKIPNGTAAKTSSTNANFSITVLPSYSLVNVNFSGNLVGNFTPLTKGFYYMLTNVTDDYNNTLTNYEIYYLISPNATAITQFYFRNIASTHIHPVTIDSKIMTLTPPTTTETISCSAWVQMGIDESNIIQPYLINDFNMSFWYKSDTAVSTAIQKYFTYDEYYDLYNTNVFASSSDYIYNSSNFTNVGWTINNPAEQYFLTLKIFGSNIYVITNLTRYTYANISYNFSYPRITKNTNENIKILSAVTPASNLSNATIIISGNGKTNLSVQMINSKPHLGYLDNLQCNTTNVNCNFTQDSLGALTFNLTLTTQHNLSIDLIDNNFICSDISKCEYQNLSYALNQENNTGNVLYLLENNTWYWINQSTRYTNVSLQFSNNINLTINCNKTSLNSTGSLYVFNFTNTIDTTITNCSFYNKPIYFDNLSKGNVLWYNNFYKEGIVEQRNNVTGCYSSKGNFYDYRIPYSSMAPGECGLVNITSPSSQSSSNPITITWTAQSSYNTITYILEYVLNGIRTTIGTTTSTSYSWNVPGNGNYTINIIPQGSNGTHRNSTVLVDIPEQTETPSSMPSGGGTARDVNIDTQDLLSRLESVQGFTTDISETALNVIVNEIKTQSIQLTNPTQYNLIIKVILDKNLVDIIKPSENYFLLKPDETKIITFDILAKEPGEYKGVIKLVSDKYQRVIEVNIIAKAGQINDITKPLIINKITLRERVSSFFIWIGNIIILIVNWFKALF